MFGMMAISLLCTVASVTFFPDSANPDVKSIENVKVVADLDSNVFVVGEPVDLRIRIVNNDETPIEFNNGYFEVVRKVLLDGNEVARTAFGQKYMPPSRLFYSGPYVKVGTNEEYQREIPLDVVFDLTLPGKYVVELSDRYRADSSWTSCKATVEFEVSWQRPQTHEAEPTVKTDERVKARIPRRKVVNPDGIVTQVSPLNQ